MGGLVPIPPMREDGTYQAFYRSPNLTGPCRRCGELPYQ